MKVNKGAVIAIGVFDGVHIGHRKIIKSAVGRAGKLGLKSVVLTFDPHPMKVIRPGAKVPSLISICHRVRLIKEIGAAAVVILKFTKAVARMSAGEFIGDVLIKRFGMKELYVGQDFRFGAGAVTGIKDLGLLASAYDFRLNVVKPVKADRQIVSSSAIRRLIMKGDIRKAQKFLGRPVSVLGTVVSGARLARELGYPTANINPHHEVIPPSGVYAVRVRLNKDMLNGVLNIGFRPTFYGPRDKEPSIEVHIFDFNKRIYGKDLEIFFVRKIRDESRFADKDALVEQVRKDENAARSILN